jgi:hypothetical protein
MDFDEVLRVFLLVIKDWRVLVITAAVLLYLVVVMLASGTRKKTISKSLPKFKFKGVKMPKINIKMMMSKLIKKDKAPGDEESEDEEDEPRGERKK